MKRDERVKHKACANEHLIEIYKQHYKNIGGGIDGYYERTILDSPMYQVYEDEIMAFFSIHQERGLTSLVVLPAFMERYDSIFTYVMGLPLFTQMLFTEKDEHFHNHVLKSKIQMEIQAVNFEANRLVKSSIQMKPVHEEDVDKIREAFGSFIEYNSISLSSNPSFYYEIDEQLISFGSMEPLRLHANRYCISMIVNEKYRNQGFGCETVKFLIEYLQTNGYEANARCYVHNAASKKTLLKSGLHISNLLYRATKESAKSL